MYYIELSIGLRRGELLGLKWSDIDRNNAVITIKRQVVRVNGEITEAPLKTKNSYRTVTISPQTVEVLKQQKEKTNSDMCFLLRCPKKSSGLRFILDFFDRCHSLRSLLPPPAALPSLPTALQNGVDIKTVSSILGHFSAGFTLDTYAHVTTAAQKEAALTMGNVLSV